MVKDGRVTSIIQKLFALLVLQLCANISIQHQDNSTVTIGIFIRL